MNSIRERHTIKETHTKTHLLGGGNNPQKGTNCQYRVEKKLFVRGYKAQMNDTTKTATDQNYI